MKISIIGAGTMGSGIAQVAATAGWEVVLYDVSGEMLERSHENLRKIMLRLVEKGKISIENSVKIRGLIDYVKTIEPVADSDMVIEAIVEDLGVKHKVLSGLESYVSPECIIASNTSSLSIASLAAILKKPDRFIGIHFFNPAPLMKLVEIIPAVQTESRVIEQAQAVIQSWGKTTVLAKDTPGFIVNKVARPFYGESLRIHDEGLAGIADIDWAMKELGGFRMGPFQLMDFIGNDVNYMVTESVFHAFYFDPRYKPSFTQKRLAEAGFLGRKAGRGFYDYREGASNPEPNQDPVLGKMIFERVLAMLINEAADTVHLGIANKEDIDFAMTKGVNYPKGLLAWADEIGIARCVEMMDALYEEYHEDRYRCSPLLRKMAKGNLQFFPTKEKIDG